ncbi:MAG: UbiX family flavin prenyltransferase [Oscillospiraceae bacterium]|nr:UbiX family flavin prenyltransferase [Oscillospiraceae bacterium]
MKLIVGISGASGVIMGFRLLETLRKIPDAEVYLVVTEDAKVTWQLETDRPFEDLLALADVVCDIGDMAASISSGSFATDGMIILPCSMKTLAGIVSGYADNLLLRAADVCLKEGRKLVICPREMPMSRIHLRNMKEAADAGCTIVPPVLTFYNRPQTIENQIDHVIGKILMQFGIIPESFKPWK